MQLVSAHFDRNIAIEKIMGICNNVTFVKKNICACDILLHYKNWIFAEVMFNSGGNNSN